MTRTTSQATAQQSATLHRALSDPSRVRILEVLQEAEAPPDARELGTRLGLHVNTVRSHLRVLAEANLVSARREERTRPGRPRVLYEATPEPLDAPGLASYRLLAQILASSLAGSERDPSARAEEAGRAWGAHLIRKPAPFTSISKEETIDEIVRLHEQLGFRPSSGEPRAGRSSCSNAVPQEEATTYQSVICPVHLGLIRGALAELGTGEGKLLRPGDCVICADEKPSIQARLREHETVPPRSGSRGQRVEHRYQRRGALTYLAALDIRRARVFGRPELRGGIDPFDRLVQQVMTREPYASARRVFWIVDNGSSHRGQRSIERLERRWRNLVLVHLPLHASWLNQIEIYFSIVQRKVLEPNDFADVAEVARTLNAFERHWSGVAEPFDWRFTRDDLERLLERLYAHEPELQLAA